MLIDKLKAFMAHLLISAVLVTLTLSGIIYFWYPLDYIQITNFLDIALLIVFIDIVLGPLLTFVIFNRKKKSLHFDLVIIGIIQISALMYGTNALYQVHPLFIAYNHGRFNIIQANEVDPKNAQYDQFNISKLSTPKLVYAKMPDDPEISTDIMLGVDLKGEPDIDRRPEYYEPHKNHMSLILEESLDTATVFTEKNLNLASKKFLKTNANKLNELTFIPLKGSGGSAIIVLNKKTAEVVTTINTNPWHLTKK